MPFYLNPLECHSSCKIIQFIISAAEDQVMFPPITVEPPSVDTEGTQMPVLCQMCLHYRGRVYILILISAELSVIEGCLCYRDHNPLTK